MRFRNRSPNAIVALLLIFWRAGATLKQSTFTARIVQVLDLELIENLFYFVLFFAFGSGQSQTP